MSFDATYLTRRIQKFSKQKVVGVSLEQAEAFKRKQLNIDELVPLSNLFAFIVTPINNKFPGFIAHLNFTTHGNFKEEMVEFIEVLCEEFLKINIKVKFLCFDGDKKTR